MAIIRVNKLGTALTASTGQTSITLTVGATTTAHNRIIVCVTWAANNPSLTVTDSKNNTYAKDASGLAGVNGGYSAIFSARGDAVLTGSTDTITVTWSGQTVSYPIIAAYEYSGLANFVPLDLTSSATGTSGSPSGSITTNFANELIIGLIAYTSTGNFTLPSQTQLDAVTNFNHSLETQEDIVAATGTYTMSGTISGTAPQWLVLMAGYSDTANAASSQPANTTDPAITGSGVLGMQLTCSQGSWSNNPTAYAYQWKRAGVNITGATGAHYLVVSADVGNALTCTVTASNKYGSVAQAASNSVTPAVNTLATGLGI